MSSGMKAASFLIQPVEGKGLGVVANCDFKPGQLILSEAVLILSRQERSDWLTANQARQIFKQVARLTRDQRQQMMELHCMGEKKILKVFRTNCICVDETNFGLFLNISRVNHSCCPNSVDCKGMVKEVRAIKHINRGEEITMSYLVNNWDIQANRRKELSYWQFECACQVCSLTGRDLLHNEEIRQEIIEKDDALTKFVDSVIAVQDNAATMLEDDRRLLQCHIYVNIRQMVRVAEDKLNLVNKMGHQMKMKLFTSHLQCLLLYCKARALGVPTVQQADQRVEHHGQQLSKMSGCSQDWRVKFCEALGRGMMFSVGQG